MRRSGKLLAFPSNSETKRIRRTAISRCRMQREMAILATAADTRRTTMAHTGGIASWLLAPNSGKDASRRAFRTVRRTESNSRSGRSSVKMAAMGVFVSPVVSKRWLCVLNIYAEARGAPCEESCTCGVYYSGGHGHTFRQGRACRLVENPAVGE